MSNLHGKFTQEIYKVHYMENLHRKFTRYITWEIYKGKLHGRVTWGFCIGIGFQNLFHGLEYNFFLDRQVYIRINSSELTTCDLDGG